MNKDKETINNNDGNEPTETGDPLESSKPEPSANEATACP